MVLLQSKWCNASQWNNSDGYKVDGEGRWLPNGVTTTTTTTTTTTSTTETTTAEETTPREDQHRKQPLNQQRQSLQQNKRRFQSIPDKTSEITDANGLAKNDAPFLWKGSVL